MAIVEPSPRVTPRAEADIDRFAGLLERYRRGELDEQAFRIVRLNNGIYGQRQGGNSMMVRVKAPFGSLTAEQLDRLGQVASLFSRGVGHLTTRQCVQFHFVELDRTPDLLRTLEEVGLTTREACGDTVRNVTACPLAGVCPLEVLDVSPWAEATFAHFLRHAYAQRLPRKFKIGISGCAADCALALCQDVGVIAVSRSGADGGSERGFQVLIAGGLAANPRPAQPLEPFTPRSLLLPTLEAVLRTFDHYGNRDNKLRARQKWLVETMGFDELQARVLRERDLLVASVTWVDGLPEAVMEHGDDPAGALGEIRVPGVCQPAAGADRPAGGTRRSDDSGYARWASANVAVGAADSTVSAYVWAPLGDVTAEQFRALAALQAALGAEVRLTNRQDLVFRGLAPPQLGTLYHGLTAVGLGQPSAGLAHDVVSCPGAATCNLAVTQSRGLATAIGQALEEAGLAEVPGVRVNVSGCTNSCGQHHLADIGCHGVERRAHGRPAPGYQLLLGGGSRGLAAKALRLPARATAAAVVEVVRRFSAERRLGEDFASWLARVGGARAVATQLADLDHFPSPEEGQDFYVDLGETAPFAVDVGPGECAGA